MRRKTTISLLLCLLVIALVTSSAAAQGNYYRSLNPYVSMYNGSMANIPGFLSGVLRNQQVELIMQQSSGDNEVLGVITDATGKISEFKSEAPDSPTLRVTVTPGTAERLIEENSGVAVLQAIGSDIRIQGVGLGNAARALIFRIGASIARLFV